MIWVDTSASKATQTEEQYRFTFEMKDFFKFFRLYKFVSNLFHNQLKYSSVFSQSFLYLTSRYYLHYLHIVWHSSGDTSWNF